MSAFEPNYKRGRQYFWVSHSILSMLAIGGSVPATLGIKGVYCFVSKPKSNAKDYTRISIQAVRTQRECDALQRKWARIRARIARKFAKSRQVKTVQ